MPNLLRVSEAVSLGLHTMALLARYPDRRFSTAEIAGMLHASEHTLAKVLQTLSRSRLADSVRGPNGGFTLARPAAEITLLEIYEAIEGPIGPSTCLLGSSACNGKECALGDLVHSIHDQVRSYFARTSLAELASKATVLTVD